ncbi:MAG: alpha/beta fold hydrolase [Rhodoferax sp.]|nr:alpha/beta fold hydrolase [Rhodoferax sp.]
MLARLLRGLLLTQFLVGAAVGYWLGGSVAAALLLGVALPFAVMVLTDLVSALRSRANEPASAWWRSLWGEFGAGIQVFIFRQPWTRATPTVLAPTAQATPARIPVLLVHGYLCNHRVWDDVAQALRQQGHTVLAVNLEPVFVSIDRYADIIEPAVQQLRTATGHDKVVLVGHSMGGLAIRAWMRTHGTQHAAGAITLGTPHVGTQIAKGQRTPNGRQMEWHSDWLATLAASETDAIRALFQIALTPQDNIVYPQRAQVLPGVTATVFEGLGHLQLCLDPAVLQWLLARVVALDAPA